MSQFTRGGAIAIFLAAVSSLPRVAAQTPPVEKYRLAGRIVDALSNRPITDVDLVLNTAKWLPAADPVAPDAEGRFVFDGLPAGQYILSATRADFGTIFYGQLPHPNMVNTIHVGPGKEDALIVFRLVPRGSISGTVRDEFGDPMVRANVSLSRELWNDGKVVRHNSGPALTDDRGQYRASNVVPGTYAVCADAGMGRNVIAPSSSTADFLSSGSMRYYARACTHTISIAPGEAVTANLTFTSTPAVRIRGRIVKSPPRIGPGLRLISDDPEQPWSRNAPDSFDAAKGEFEFRGVLSGKYHLQAELRDRATKGEIVSLAAWLPLTVGSYDVDNIELVLQPTGEIEVVLHGVEENELDRNAVTLGLWSTVPEQYETRWAFPEGNQIRFAGVPAGVYWLLTRSEATACVQSAKLGEQEMLHGIVTVSASMKGRLDVTVSKSCGLIKGRVIANGQPVPEAKVLLLLSGSAENPGNMVTGFTDEQGEFSFPGLPFGRYQLWAWSVDESSGFVGPRNLAAVAKRAITVDVSSDEPIQVDLTPLKPEAQ